MLPAVGLGESHGFRRERKPVPETLRDRNGMTFFCHMHELKAREGCIAKQKALFKAQILDKQTKTRAPASPAVLVLTCPLPGRVGLSLQG